MGRSKFPGKPSKSVMKERIRVLHKNENGKSEKDASFNTNKKDGGEDFSCNYSSLKTRTVNFKDQLGGKLNVSTDCNSINKTTILNEDPTESIVKTNAGESGINQKHHEILEQNEEKEVSSTGTSAVLDSSINSTKYSLTEIDRLIKKKTVTFKNVLETSDDTSVIKKVYNPGNNVPLVSIMKKECFTAQGYTTRGDGIVRPSRLTEILKNNANIDKTNSLSFRTAQITNKPSDSCENKRLDSSQALQTYSPSTENSSKIRFLEKESEFENIGKPEQQSSEDSYIQPLDKWNLHKLGPKTDDFDTTDELIGNECRRRSPKRKDSTLHNKIILRQPRLHFEPQCEKLVKAKQNILNNTNNTTSLPPNLSGTQSVCGVCSTTVNSKNLQNRKYGIIACDACRKFISKITKKTVSSSTNPLTAFKIQCSKRDGECVISSLPKNNVKSFKKIYDERCTACWLKKCIKAFHFPSGHKLRLNAILTETHNSKIEVQTINKPFDLIPSSSVNTFKYGSKLLSENDNANSQTNGMSWRVITPSDGLIESVQSRHGDFASVNSTSESHLDNNSTLDVYSTSKQTPCVQTLINNGFSASGKHTRLYTNSILNKKSETLLCQSLELQSTNSIVTPEYQKRQKIDFKGPRVKHVCRSASIALGQQIATFSNDDEETSKLPPSKSGIENSSLTNSLLANMYFSGNDQENYSQKTTDDCTDEQFKDDDRNLNEGFAVHTVDAKRQPSQNPFANTEKNQIEKVKEKRTVFEKSFVQEKNNTEVQKSGQKSSGTKNLLMLAHRKMTSLSKRNLMRITKPRKCENKSPIISIDFWDAYVPAEVNQTGFGLILSEPAPICALCFLCGSMDLDYLLFCASCCEPYHSYCIQEENNSVTSILQGKYSNDLINQLNWVCPRCTVCYTCNMSSGAKIKCQKCKKNYHSTCIGTSKGLLGADRPLICRNCLKCQTCSTTKVSKYVGNQPICMQCFKFRKSGCRCPLCNNLFDSILDLTILECGICEKLIHTKCESLTEEQSNLLSNLPESIKFVCKKCTLANDNAKLLAKEWREAVYEELKAGLLDVLKLISRSRQADVLKKTVRKNCRCVFEQIRQNHHILSHDNCKNQNPQAKEGLTGANDYVLNDLVGSTLHKTCLCSSGGLFQQSKLNNALCLFDIKKKIINGEYVSLFDFNTDMNDVIMPLKNDELILAYKEILSEKFPWFQNETKTCTDALEEDMFESCNYSFQLDEEGVTEDQHTTTKLPESVEKVLNSLKKETDNRMCLLCLKHGDGGVLQESRLLYYGYNTWVHANCAIWSNDVYEEFDGTLQNVHNTVNQGRLIKCSVCKWSGATIKCVVKTCRNCFHFQCARRSECVFKSDKSVYCLVHCTEQKNCNSSTNDKFTVSRPLYIEFDKSRRKYVEASKVQFIMGSLSVLQLGTVYSKFSDTSEAIVPINFLCTRLYWSCSEPWKIVKYSVRTLIQHNSVMFANDIGKNFTVDHTKNINQVETGLSQIAMWHNTLIHQEAMDTNFHHEYGQFSNLRFPTDGDNNNETISDLCVEEEPQNNSDLLPPEIKDAIFEDLPHDILDGISMLDIFPKLMIYEDIIALEGKSENMITEATENSTLQLSEECPSFNYSNKQQEINNKFPYNMNHTEDTSPPTHTIGPKRELQRSNSEVFLRNLESYRSQQRSSSVTWSCKFDNSKRYLTKGLSDVGLSETRRFNSNYRKAESEYDTYKTNIKNNVIFEDNKHTKKDKFKLMQLDGTDDTIMSYLSTNIDNAASKNPVKCERCHCTYRTFDSFQRHLASCEPISTSESETEAPSRSPGVSCSTIVFQDDSIKNNLHLYQNQLANNQKLTANISIVSEPNIISPEKIVPQSIFVSNSGEYDDGFYVNVNNTGYNIDNKNNSGINNAYVENSWPTVGVNSFNRSISKNKRVKCDYNFANSNTAKNGQYKILAKTQPETIVTPETINIINNKAEYSSQNKNSYLQFLNQHLVLNNQYSQKEQQSQQQQFVVIQQSVGNNQPLFLQQVPNPAPVPQNIFPVVLANNSMQYASIPTSTNPLVQGSILQTDVSGNVILSSGLQMLSMPSLQLASQSSPQLVGSFNQPQSLHLGQNQMLIGSPATMELMPNANQVLLTAPPIYYGLETIVQNTVMSSQQFVSTAMQGVLSQNASFSATTTQVFQSSKFEPVNDTPSGYVILNNADGTAIVVPQTNLLSGFINTNNAHDFHSNYTQDFGNLCGTHPQTFIQQPPPSNILPIIPALADMTSIPVETPINRIQAPVSLESSSHLGVPGKQTITSDQNSIPSNIKNGDVNQISMISSDCDNDFNVQNPCKDLDMFDKQIKSSETNHTHSKNRVQVKANVAHKYIKRSRVVKNAPIGSKVVYKNILQKEFKLNQPKEAIPENMNIKRKLDAETHNITTGEENLQSPSFLITHQRKLNNDLQCCTEIENKGFEGHIESSEESVRLKESNQNIVPRLNNRSVPQVYMVNTTKAPITTVSFGTNFNNVPTNIVAPILQTHQSNNTPSRPTNRVLPMQSIQKPLDKTKLKSAALKRPSLRDHFSKLLESASLDVEIKKNALPIAQNIENNNEMAIVNQKEFDLQNMVAVLKSENNVPEPNTNISYSANRITLSEKLDDASDLKKIAIKSTNDIPLDEAKKEVEHVKDVSLITTPPCDEKVDDGENKKMVDNIEVYTDTEIQKPNDEVFEQNEYLDFFKSAGLPKSSFKCKSPKQAQTEQQQFLTNNCQTIWPLSSKKRLENEEIKKASEPHLIYEVQSEDGFSYKSKSIADIWEKIFDTVQNARRAYGLSTLPLGPFADMCGVQMIGLKTNAMKFLIEQLPGTERCTKYTPKYHKNVSTNIGSEYFHQDQEELLENIYGAVRCEPFAKRSEYDLFSWLASRHRKQPKQIFVQPSDTELIARRCTANLPMAMKYRTLKETCKHNVGVFRSLIHGRGLFCTKDIEAGEMVIEYAGELIRSTLTDKRERYYDSRGIGCYMFKIDDNCVVDATMRGNAARFINHSCEPNCYSKVVDILGHKHIIIFSLRRIVQGEELTYDYKFPFEDVKIPCSCGSKKCRKYLN